MNLRKLSSIGLLSVLFLGVTACSVRMGSDGPASTPNKPAPAADVDGGAKGQADRNGEIVEVTVVGTSATSTFRALGDMGITVLPRNAAGEIVLADNLAIDVTFSAPGGLKVDVGKTECTAVAPNVDSSAIGIIIDDSKSMT